MIRYLRCTEVSQEQCYEAFKQGFADYMIKLELPFDAFIKRFFGPEGNRFQHSFIALDGERPAGIVLGGIREFMGRKTMRCGGMCVIPEFRWKGVAVELFQRHKQEAIEKGCSWLFLEVITKNLPAVRFYKRIGYQKIYDLSYFIMEDATELKNGTGQNVDIRTVDMEELKILRHGLKELHINWQNETDYIEALEDQYHYGIYEQEELIAALSINKTGQIYFIYVKPGTREKGMAGTLLTHAAKELDLEKMKTGFPNNAFLECFFKAVGFKKERIAQYEMFQPLPKSHGPL